MAELTDADKREIVLLIAADYHYSEVVALMRDEHEVETTVQQVRTYDPRNPRFEASKKWIPVFEAARAAYIHELSLVPMAHQTYRMNELQKLYRQAVKAKNRVLAAALLEQAAKEEGGLFSNVRNVNMAHLGELTADERRARVASIFDQALGRDPRQNADGPDTEQ